MGGVWMDAIVLLLVHVLVWGLEVVRIVMILHQVFQLVCIYLYRFLHVSIYVVLVMVGLLTWHNLHVMAILEMRMKIMVSEIHTFQTFMLNHFSCHCCAQRVSLDNIESHFEDVLHLELIPETLFFFCGIDVAQSLTTATMFNTHF